MNVAVLKGGRSLEREISLRSGGNAEAALRRLGHDVLAVDVDQHLVRALRAERPDAAFIALHGKGGEDGTIQELLEILEVPYTGSGVLACERAWDKVVAKAHFATAGIPTPPGYAFSQDAFRELGAGEAIPRSGSGWACRWWSSPPSRARRSASRWRARRPTSRAP